MKILILGGGMSGLFCGLNLSKDHDVTILESDSILGGLASSFKLSKKDYLINNAQGILSNTVSANERLIPQTYHHFLPSEKLILKYLQDFEIGRAHV